MLYDRLTKSERALLRGLERDGRTPLGRIAKRHRISPQALHYALQSLASKELLSGTKALIDYARLGMIQFKVYFKVAYVHEERIHALVSALRASPHSSIVATIGGRHDLLCGFYAPNPSQFNKMLRALIAEHDEILRYTILTCVVNRWWGRRYAVADLPEFIYGGDRPVERLSETELHVLRRLGTDGRMSAVAIGAGELSAKHVIEVTKRLRRKEVVLTTIPLVNTETMGGSHAFLVIRYHLSGSREPAFIEYLHTIPHVVGITKTFGEWDVEIEVEAEHEKQLRQLELDLRQRFPELIHDLDRIPIYRMAKRTWCPENI